MIERQTVETTDSTKYSN